ncbi:MAG: hypothetical protein RI969_1463 [Verrucomicrobiota bacterium]|jgi:hypothetical protein
MEAIRSLQEQAKECEEWCSRQEPKAYLPSARKGLRVLPAHHGELATPLAGCELRTDGGVFKEKPLGVVIGGLMIISALILWVGVAAQLYLWLDWTGAPAVFSALLSVPIVLLVAYLPARVIFLEHQVVFADDFLVVRLQSFGRTEKECRLATGEVVGVGLAFRDQFYHVENATRYYPLLSVVVSSDGQEVAFGEKLPLEQRVRLAVLIDHYYNGPESYGHGPDNPRVG